MTKSVKNKLLNQLNILKSIGYTYHKSLDININEVDTSILPNNISSLKNNVEHCYLCDLSKSRKNILFGYGNENANVMFIGDEPSQSEDSLATFYTGNSGKLLSKMIENVLKIKKEEVYITNLVKCRSSDSLNKTHLDSCNLYLKKQIELINPKIIVLLGEKTFSYFYDNKLEFEQNRGKELTYNSYSLISIYSPSHLLRNPSSKKDAFYDMLKIKNIMEIV